MGNLLEIRDLDAGYAKRPVLYGVSLHIAPGEVVALVGPNGAGKSTLLRAIFGLVEVSRGSIIFRGREIRNRNPSDNVKNGISYVLQGSRVFTELSVGENLEVSGCALPASDIKARIEEVLSLFPDLRPLQKRSAATLSTGEKQMLAMARALILKPALLLADEPSLGLGPKLAQAALSHIRDVNERYGAAVLLVEQNVREAMAIAQRVYALKLGRVVLVDKPENLTPEVLRQVFLG